MCGWKRLLKLAYYLAVKFKTFGVVYQSMLTLRYVNRKINTIDEIVEDDELINRIKDENLALVYGLPGVGKTSTALYVACRFLDEG